MAGPERRRVALIRYPSFDAVPAQLKRVAAIALPPGHGHNRLQETNATWFNPGDAIPSWMVQYGAVECSTGSVIPPSVMTIAAL